MEVGYINMDSRIHVERLKEQYNILANLIANIPTELGETNVNIVTGYDTFEDQTIFELFIVTHTDINPYIKLRYIILRQNISQFKYMEVGCIDMDNRIHVERLKEQYNILADLITNIPTELGETNVNIVTGYDTFEDQTIFELSRFIFVGEGNNPMESRIR